MKKYLVINAGSSSLKFSLYEMPMEKLLVNGYFEKIGMKDSFWTIKLNGDKIKREGYLSNHTDAVNMMIKELIDNRIVSSMSEIVGVGHRVLHGGELYSSSVEITDLVLDNIKKMTKLGPLHHPGEIAGIEAMKKVFSDIKQVAVFDTAFHQTMPEDKYMYAVPYEWYQKYKVRKYGFHGTSCKYITEYMKKELNKEEVNLIICHVGSGASITCVKNGFGYNTSMGLTPLDGLIMRTRCGNIDPSIIKYVMDETSYDILKIDEELNNYSGMLGLCDAGDFREVIAKVKDGDEKAILAYNMCKDSIVKYIAEYYFELNGEVDAIVFTAGILENNPIIREELIDKLSKPMNIYLNKEINENIGYGLKFDNGLITMGDSKVAVYVIPTNEEVMILRDTYEVINR